MNVPQNQPPVPPEEELFLRKALAGVEKAEKFQKLRRIAASILAFAYAFWLASRPASPEVGVECTIIIMLGLALAVCTAKLQSLINKNTKVVLQAIAELQQR